MRKGDAAEQHQLRRKNCLIRQKKDAAGQPGATNEKDAAGQSQAEEENVAADSPDDVDKCGVAGQPNVINGDAC